MSSVHRRPNNTLRSSLNCSISTLCLAEMDFHMAAASKYSTGEAHVRQAGPAPNWPVQEEDDEDFDTLSQLPTVDDLEVAAAAAAAGMEELAESSSEAESDSEDATSSVHRATRLYVMCDLASGGLVCQSRFLTVQKC